MPATARSWSWVLGREDAMPSSVASCNMTYAGTPRFRAIPVRQARRAASRLALLNLSCRLGTKEEPGEADEDLAPRFAILALATRLRVELAAVTSRSNALLSPFRTPRAEAVSFNAP